MSITDSTPSSCSIWRGLKPCLRAWKPLRGWRRAMDTQAMKYRPLNENDPNLAFNRDLVKEGKAAYIVSVKRSDTEFVAKLQKLLKEAERLYRKEDRDLPRIHFDGHLYLPLLVQGSDKFTAVPPALNKSEAQFVRDLKAFWEKEKDGIMAGKEVYVLRNLSRGKGVGFFENSGFYPDFILWVVDTRQRTQRIIFIEPHGMLQAKAYIHDEKARLPERLPQLAQDLAKKSNRTGISLNSFIISVTPYNELYQHYDDGTWGRAKFSEKHILFQERNGGYDYIELLLGSS